MPELPEVETTRRGIADKVTLAPIKQVVVRQAQLRYPIARNMAQQLAGQTIQHVTRRGKYLLLACPKGTLIIHLGMSGCLRIVDSSINAARHDHVDIIELHFF